VANEDLFPTAAKMMKLEKFIAERETIAFTVRGCRDRRRYPSPVRHTGPAGNAPGRKGEFEPALFPLEGLEKGEGTFSRANWKAAHVPLTAAFACMPDQDAG